MTKRRITVAGLVLTTAVVALGASRVESRHRDSTVDASNRAQAKPGLRLEEPPLYASQRHPSDDGTPIHVRVQTVETVTSFTVPRSYTGMIVSRRSSELGFDRSAKIVTVLVDQGDVVAQGQPLAQLDIRQLETEKRRTTAQRDQALAVLDELKAGPRRETIDAAAAEVQDLMASVELQQRGFQRVTALLQQNAASKDRYDSAELGLRSAEAKLAAAQRRLDELESGTRQEQITAQTAVVAQLDAQLSDIDIEIDDSTLKSPFDGRIARRYVDEGTVVSASQQVVKVVESGVLEAEVGLAVQAAANLEANQTVRVDVAGKTWLATLDRLLPEVDLQTRTRVAIFRLGDDAATELVPGQVARVTLDETRATEGLWVPTTSLVRSYRGLWATYVVDVADESGIARVERRDVETLFADGHRTLVRGTLQPGDRVIVSGTHRVVPGQRVVIQ